MEVVLGIVRTKKDVCFQDKELLDCIERLTQSNVTTGKRYL